MLKNLLACSILLKGMGVFAQPNPQKLSATTAQHPKEEIDWENFDQYLEDAAAKNNPEWVFHTNAQNKVLLVNLSRKNTKAARLSVKSSDNQIVFEDANLSELSPNSIYEIDLLGLNTGAYRVLVEYENTDTQAHELLWSKN